MTTATNLLRLRLARNIESCRANLDEMRGLSGDGRAIACAITKLDEMAMWADRALPQEPEPKRPMGATDDPRSRS